MASLIPWRKKSNVKVRPNGKLASTRYDDESYPMARFRREFDRLWDRFWDDWSDLHEGRGLAERQFQLEDNENEYLVQAELPGYEPSEIDVNVSGNVMTVRAEHKEQENGPQGSHYRTGQLYESFTLPQGVLADKIDARYHNGVLELHLPKSGECKSKRITVQSD